MPLDDGAERTILLHHAAQKRSPHSTQSVQPVRLGPPVTPAAVKTQLGWTLQCPARDLVSSPSNRCYYISFKFPLDDIHHNVEKLWQLNTLPQRSKKMVVHSKQDQKAIHLLETKTIRILVDGVQHYATPLL